MFTIVSLCIVLLYKLYLKDPRLVMWWYVMRILCCLSWCLRQCVLSSIVLTDVWSNCKVWLTYRVECWFPLSDWWSRFCVHCTIVRGSYICVRVSTNIMISPKKLGMLSQWIWKRSYNKHNIFYASIFHYCSWSVGTQIRISNYCKRYCVHNGLPVTWFLLKYVVRNKITSISCITLVSTNTLWSAFIRQLLCLFTVRVWWRWWTYKQKEKRMNEYTRRGNLIAALEDPSSATLRYRQ